MCEVSTVLRQSTWEMSSFEQLSLLCVPLAKILQFTGPVLSDILQHKNPKPDYNA